MQVAGLWIVLGCSLGIALLVVCFQVWVLPYYDRFMHTKLMEHTAMKMMASHHKLNSLISKRKGDPSRRGSNLSESAPMERFKDVEEAPMEKFKYIDEVPPSDMEGLLSTLRTIGREEARLVERRAAVASQLEKLLMNGH